MMFRKELLEVKSVHCTQIFCLHSQRLNPNHSQTPHQLLPSKRFHKQWTPPSRLAPHHGSTALVSSDAVGALHPVSSRLCHAFRDPPAPTRKGEPGSRPPKAWFAPSFFAEACRRHKHLSHVYKVSMCFLQNTDHQPNQPTFPFKHFPTVFFLLLSIPLPLNIIFELAPVALLNIYTHSLTISHL